MIFSKKHLFYFGIIFFSIGSSFFAGILIAKKKINNIKLNATSKVYLDLSKNRIEDPIISEINNEAKNENNVLLASEDNENENVNEEAESQLENKFVFGIIGDTQYFKEGNSNGGFQKAARNIFSKSPEAVFGIGDIVSSCDGKNNECESKFIAWKTTFGNLSSQVYAVQGNHDRTGREKADEVWQKVFNFPTNGPAGFSELAYSFDKKNSHFVVLDSEKPNENIINLAQRNWLEQDLSRNQKENTFVFFHEPAYPTNSKIGESLDAEPKERDALWEILSRHEVTAVFSGHEHVTSRRNVNGVYQFVFGNTDSFNHLAPRPGMAEYSYVGQVFGIVEVSGKDVTVNTYSIDGKMLNSFPLLK